MAAYRFFFLSGHKLFLNFLRTLNLRSLTRTWFLEKLDSNHCRELQGHRGNKRVYKRHGTRLDRKPFSPRRANEEASHLFVISDFFIKKKKKKWRNILTAMFIYPCSVFFQWLRLNDLLQMLWLNVSFSFTEKASKLSWTVSCQITKFC